MPITKCAASKATPAKGIDYIMNPEKVIARGSQGFVSQDPKKMARQMLQTMHLFGKGYNREERKYYHAKVSFDPADREENGGTLDAGKANRFAAEYARNIWPSREVVWAVQNHGASIHIHFIVAACERDTGKKLDVRDAEYRQWKDRAQELAKEYGLSTIDWRKTTRNKREQEAQGLEATKETFAEQGLKARGKATWKDELRSIIDQAAASCNSMDEFRAVLESQGVTLTRCTEQTISYKMGDHRACRGDTLGGDYTMAAIRDDLRHNKQRPANDRAERGAYFDAKGTHMALIDIKPGEPEGLRVWKETQNLKRKTYNETIDRLISDGELTKAQAVAVKNTLYEQERRDREFRTAERERARREREFAYQLRNMYYTDSRYSCYNPNGSRKSIIELLIVLATLMYDQRHPDKVAARMAKEWEIELPDPADRDNTIRARSSPRLEALVTDLCHAAGRESPSELMARRRAEKIAKEVRERAGDPGGRAAFDAQIRAAQSIQNEQSDTQRGRRSRDEDVPGGR